MPDASPNVRTPDRRVLVVEDDYLLADDLRRELGRLGIAVLGPVPTVAEALDLLAGPEAPDAALLDLNLGGELVFAVADALAARGVPFAFLTGYDRWAWADRYADAPRFEKPVDLGRAIGALLA